MANVESVLVYPTQTSFKWYSKTYRAELTIDASDLRQLIVAQSKSPELPDQTIFRRNFGGESYNDWTVIVKLIAGVHLNVVFMQRNFQAPQTDPIGLVFVGYQSTAKLYKNNCFVMPVNNYKNVEKSFLGREKSLIKSPM